VVFRQLFLKGTEFLNFLVYRRCGFGSYVAIAVVGHGFEVVVGSLGVEVVGFCGMASAGT